MYHVHFFSAASCILFPAIDVKYRYGGFIIIPGKIIVDQLIYQGNKIALSGIQMKTMISY